MFNLFYTNCTNFREFKICENSSNSWLLIRIAMCFITRDTTFQRKEKLCFYVFKFNNNKEFKRQNLAVIHYHISQDLKPHIHFLAQEGRVF